jgi:RimJ/RimL family protein N-acetyltransferase
MGEFLMLVKDIYEVCPTYEKKLITLRQTRLEDTEELLECYSDEKSVPLFNSDNCHGDDFYYTTIERMKQAIDFWDFSYKNKYFVRWTVLIKGINRKIGTVEMFHRIADDEFNHYGVMRIDLRSDYETQPIINEILEIANDNFYEAFGVKAILTKAIPDASQRIASLVRSSYRPLMKKLNMYDDYFVKSEKE